jgi:hypothetical protein
MAQDGPTLGDGAPLGAGERVATRECSACRGLFGVRSRRSLVGSQLCVPVECPHCGALEDDVVFDAVEVWPIQRDGPVLALHRAGTRVTWGLRLLQVRLGQAARWVQRKARGLQA